MPIRVLDQHTRDLIAAGEVIDGPFSVVRELWDNAVDAGARRIRIELLGGGTRVIRITDDGIGMDRADAEAAFLRHATSKITHIDDLRSLSSLGFRGEALASIAAVARVELITRSREHQAGTRVMVCGGEVQTIEEVGAPSGTTVIVSDLFFNTPVRKTNLSKPAQETARCLDVLRNRAVARPDIAVTVISDSRKALSTSGSKSAETVLGELFGMDIIEQLLPVCGQDNDIHITGCIGRPDLNRPSRTMQFLVISGRPVVPGMIGDAVQSVYKSLLPRHRHPVFLLYITVDPAEVDINVHPTKSEVRLSRERVVIAATAAACNQALAAGRLISRGTTVVLEDATPYTDDRSPVSELVMEQRFEQQAMENSTNPDQSELSHLEVMGQLGASYIICSAPSGLFIIDQHAAHERIYLDQLLESETPADKQALLAPETVQVTPEELEIAASHSELLTRSGYEVEPFGLDSLIIRSTPAGLEGGAAISALIQTLAAWARGGKHSDIHAARVALAACKAAIKANQHLSLQQMKALVNELAASTNPTRCAHGRPTVIHLDWEELRRGFLRT